MQGYLAQACGVGEHAIWQPARRDDVKAEAFLTRRRAEERGDLPHEVDG